MNIITSGRFWLAGPAAFFLSVAVMLGMAVWFPKGAAQVDNIILPMILFPFIWAVLFFYAYLDRKLIRSVLAFAGIAALHVALLLNHFIGGGQ